MHFAAMMLLLWQVHVCLILISLFANAGWNHMMFSAGGYGKGQLTNSHAGVQLCLKRRMLCERNVVQVLSIPPELQGRGGALRVKRADADFCFIVCYFHPSSNQPYPTRVNSALWKWVDTVVSQLPARCVPCVLGDINAKVGKEGVGDGLFALSDNNNLGPCNPEIQNHNGEQLHTFLHTHFMSAVNTFHPVGPTYFGIVAGYTSRVDYICLPTSLLGSVQNCCVWHATGDDLQLVAAPGKRDHRPIQVVVEHTLAASQNSASGNLQWDADKLMRGVLQGAHRAPFVQAVEERCRQLLHSDCWQQATSQGPPDTTWTLLRKLVVDAAKPFFVRADQAAKPDARPPDTVLALQRQHSCKLHLQRLPRTSPVWSCGVDASHVPMQALSDLLRRWQATVRYQKAQKAAKKLTTRDKRARSQQLVGQIASSWAQRDFRRMWHLARVLSGRQVGPKRRRYDQPPSCRPNMQEWTQHMQQHGPAGGCRAQATDWATHQRQHAAPAMSWHDKYQTNGIWRREMHVLAHQDVSQVARQIWFAKARKRAPYWTAPNEVWRMLLYPHYKLQPERTGVGFHEPRVSNFHFKQCLHALFLQIRCSNSAPIEWHCSQGAQLDKQNGKPLCHGIRLVNMLDPMGKHFYRHIWRQGRPLASRDYAAGYAKSKSREEAILQQLCLGHRLHKAKVGCATFFKDVANAFYSPEHVHLDAAIDTTMRPCDRQLLKQRHHAASIHIQAADGNILLAVGSGALQGDSIASELFLEQYHPLVDRWLADLAASDSQRHLLEAEDPINRKRVDASLSTYADDVAIKVLASTAASLQTKAASLDDHLDTALAAGGLAQNRGKQEVVVRFAGPGSHAQMRAIYTGNVALEGQVVPKARYLGEFYNYTCSGTDARKHRLQRAQVAWRSMGSFWTKQGCSRRSVSILFRAMVVETALCGLVPFILSNSDYIALDRFIINKGRCLMRGRACAKEIQPDGHVKYTAVPNDEVLRYLELANSRTELCIRRLQFWQRVVACPTRHSNLLAVMFGSFSFERNRPLDRSGCLSSAAHPWLQQLVEDVETLRDIPDTEYIPEAMDRKPLQLFSPEVAEDFLRCDFTILRRKFLCVAIPPPEFEMHDAPPPLATLDDSDMHVCNMQWPDGSDCGRRFESQRALAIHQAALQRQKQHGQLSLEAQLVVTNQCLFCRQVFANIFSTRRHVSAALHTQQCSGHGSVTNRKAEVPDSLDCQICGLHFDDLDEIHDHLEQHLEAQFF